MFTKYKGELTAALVTILIITGLALLSPLAAGQTSPGYGYGYEGLPEWVTMPEENVPSGGGGTVTTVLSIGDLGAGSSRDLTVNERAIEFISVTVSNAVSGAQMSITQGPAGPSGAPTPPGTTYTFLTITTTNIEDADISELTINFRVSREWMEVMNIPKESVGLFKLSSDGQSWNSQTTSLVDEDDDYAYYEVTLSGASEFAITGEQEEPTAPGAGFPMALLVGAIVVIVALIVIFFSFAKGR